MICPRFHAFHQSWNDNFTNFVTVTSKIHTLKLELRHCIHQEKLIPILNSATESEELTLIELAAPETQLCASGMRLLIEMRLPELLTLTMTGLHIDNMSFFWFLECHRSTLQTLQVSYTIIETHDKRSVWDWIVSALELNHYMFEMCRFDQVWFWLLDTSNISKTPVPSRRLNQRRRTPNNYFYLATWESWRLRS